jgi:hypothetical protein
MPWHPCQMEEEDEPQVGHSQSGPAGLMQSGHLASQRESGGATRWHPSDADGGDSDPVMGLSARTGSEVNPGPGTYGSAEGAEGGGAGCQARQKESTSRVCRGTLRHSTWTRCAANWPVIELERQP